jgi:nicotinate-nucleotide pyrophosphorylase (carboxylating)
MADSFESLVGKQIILRALEEDIGSGDLTTLATVPEETELRGRLVAREYGVIAGLTAALMVFQLLDDRVLMNNQVTDGQTVVPNQTLTYISGPGRALLSGERTALNLLQRMSGIATITQSYVQAVSGTHAIILDTRKTVPGLRFFDKMAVRLGGGSNHRFGLYDMALIKNNHIAAVGGDLEEAVHRTRKYTSQNCQVEIEVRTLDELRSALDLDVDRILLDNMTLHQLGEAVLMTKGKIPLEASGGVNLETVREIALTGVDFISVGALTHSVKALDISLWID